MGMAMGTDDGFLFLIGMVMCTGTANSLVWPWKTIIPICDTDNLEIPIRDIGLFEIPICDIDNIEILI